MNSNTVGQTLEVAKSSVSYKAGFHLENKIGIRDLCNSPNFLFVTQILQTAPALTAFYNTPTILTIGMDWTMKALPASVEGDWYQEGPILE